MSERRRIRWRMPVVLLLVAASALVFIWNTDQSRQHHILQTLIVAIVAGLLLFAWAILFAGFQKRVRWSLLALCILLGIVAKSSFEVTGVTGDLLPIIKLRGRKAPELATVQTPKTNSVAAAPDVSFPQFLGPMRDGVIDATLQTNWTAHPPKELWRRAVGTGWSGFAIANGLAITQEQRGQEEFVAAYNLTTGEPVWTHSDAGRHFTTLGGEGPRATPTIHSNRVYALGATGMLNCLDLQTGKRVWSKSVTAKFNSDEPEWGFAGSPLIVGNTVVVPANSPTLCAFDLESGDVAWSGGMQNNGYSSPALLTLAGEPQLVSFNSRNVSGHNPTNGAVLWEYPWPASHPHVTTPIAISTNTLLVSSGYGYGSELLEIARSGTNFTASRVWKSNRFKSKFANMIRFGKFVYGLDDGILAAIDPESGERVWHNRRVGHGQLLLVGNVLLLMAENGEVQLIDPPPKLAAISRAKVEYERAYREWERQRSSSTNVANQFSAPPHLILDTFGANAANDESDTTVARLKVFADKTWNPPALAGEYLVVRNNLEAACFRVALVAPGAARQ